MGRGKSELTKQRLEAAVEILKEIHPASVRAVCYQLFNRKLLASMEKNETNKVSRLLTEARVEGIIPRNWIVSEGGGIESIITFDDPESYADAVTNSYRRNKWNAQENRVIVISEKGTVRGTIQPVLRKYEIDFLPVGGFASTTDAFDLTDLASDKPLVILYIGDRDPSGLWMSEKDLPKRLVQYFENDEYGMTTKKEIDEFSDEDIQYWLDEFHISFSRIALLESDCVQLGEEVSFSVEHKQNDPRFTWFVDNHGSACWELDAMNPNDLRERLESQIKKYINFSEWNRYIEAERVERQSIIETVSTWKSILRQDAK